MAQAPKKIVIENADYQDLDEYKFPGAVLLTGNVRVNHDGVILTCNKAYFFLKENYLKAKRATELLGINFIDRYQNEENYHFTTQQDKNTPSLKITGYDYLINNTYNPTIIDNDEYKFELATTTLDYVVYKNNIEIVRFSVKNFLDTLIAEYRKNGKTQLGRRHMLLLSQFNR